MANTEIYAFLNPIEAGIKDIVVSKRFIDEEGKPIPFRIRAITQKENDELIRKHKKKDKKGNEYFNQQEYVQELTAVAVVYPPLESAQLQEKYGMGITGCLKGMLLAGEFAELGNAVQEHSGLNDDPNEMIEDVKNA